MTLPTRHVPGPRASIAWRLQCASAGLLLAGSVSIDAHGETREGEERAKALFDEARQLMANQQYERACGKFDQSFRLASGIGTLYNLATCEVKLGHFARAHRLFSRVADSARELGQAERARVAEGEARALESRLARIKVHVESPEPDLEVRLEGVMLVVEAGEASTLCDPGVHRLSASSATRARWTYEFDASAASSLTIVVPRVPVEPAVVWPAPTEQANGSRLRRRGPPSAHSRAQPALDQPGLTTEPRPSGGAPTVAWVLAAGGLVGLASGTVFGARFLAQNSDAKGLCPSSYSCTQSEIDRHGQLVEKATLSRTLSFTSFGVGASLMTVAGLMFLTQSPRPSPGQRSPAFPATFEARRSAWSVAVRGEF